MRNLLNAKHPDYDPCIAQQMARGANGRYKAGKQRLVGAAMLHFRQTSLRRSKLATEREAARHKL
jgi:hypothetical protein